MRLERRRKRSTFTGLALQYYLRSVAERNRVVAMVVADATGLLVAGSMRGPEAEELAAVSPMLLRRNEGAASLAERYDLPMQVAQFSMEGQSLYLCAVGERERCTGGLNEARAGIERILSVAA